MLFSASNSAGLDRFSHMQRRVSDQDSEALLSPFSIDEFKQVVFDMHLDKALGLDGLNFEVLVH